MPSNHLILCLPLLLLPSVFSRTRIFSLSWLFVSGGKYWNFSFSRSSSYEYSRLIFLSRPVLTGLISLQSNGLSRIFSSTVIQKHQLFCAQPSLWTNSHLYVTTENSIALNIWKSGALGSITTNKARGDDGIPVELFQILKYDAVKVLHSIYQQFGKLRSGWKNSVFITMPKKDNAKECSNYHTIALISHTSKVMLKILQARLQ